MKNPIKSAARTLRVFEIFDEQQRPLSVSELAEYLEIPQSSASELAKSLTSLGYLARGDNGRSYMPTLRIAVTGRWLENTLVARGSIVDLMTDLQSASGETVILAYEQGLFVQYAHVESSQRELRMEPLVGAQRLVTRSTTGIMLLTTKSDDDIGRIVRRINIEYPDFTPQSEADVIAKVSQARKDGYFINKGDLVQGVGTCAVLVPRREGLKPAALAIGAPIHRFASHIDETVHILQTTTKRYL